MALENVGTFILTEESLDRHSERVIVSGIDVRNFRNNPIMLFNHLRTTSSWWSDNTPQKDANLPIGVWKNIKKTNDQLIADAYIDTDDDFAQRIGNKIKSGIISAVSIGFKALAVSDDPEDKVQGQKGLTILKSELLEASITDIPANPNAIIQSKSVGVLNEEKKHQSDDLYFVKTFTRVDAPNTKNTKTKNMDFNILKWVKSFFGDAAKDIENEDQAKEFLAKQESLPTPETPDFSEQIKAQVAEHAKAQKEEFEAKLVEFGKTITNAFESELEKLTGHVVDLAKVVAKKTETMAQKEEEEKKREDKFGKLAEEINALKSVPSGDQPKIEKTTIKAEKEETEGDAVIAKSSKEMLEAIFG